MARIRSIKPEFWSSEQVMECSPNARLLFIGLWNFCDDHGRHPLAPKQIKALVFPGDSFSSENVSGMLDELSSNNLIERYVVDNKEYLQVTGWSHQKIDKPQKPKFPGKIPVQSATIPRTVSTEGNSEGNGKERKGSSSSSPCSEDAPAGADDDEEVQEFCLGWNDVAVQFGLPKIREAEGEREQKIRSRLSALRDVYGFEETSLGCQELFAKIRGSPWLRGEAKTGWRPTIDWIVEPENFAKVMEGAYEGKSNGIRRH